MKNIKYPEPLKQWKIVKGDTVQILLHFCQVQVISGKEKGKQGKVVQVLRKKQQLIVEGVNIVFNFLFNGIAYKTYKTR